MVQTMLVFLRLNAFPYEGYHKGIETPLASYLGQLGMEIDGKPKAEADGWFWHGLSGWLVGWLVG